MAGTEKLKQAVKEYKEGKAEAFTTLYMESSKYIYTCIYKVMTGNDNAQDAVCDIMQDTYVEISKYISQLEDEDKFLSWAGTIATRKCYAYLKKSKKYMLLNEEDDTFDNLSDSEAIIPEEVMQDKEKQRLIREIIDTELTEMQRLCVIAFYFNEQKQSEIAQELGIPENTVKTNLSRARMKIKDGVLDLEKNKDTKLYTVAPILLLLFTEDVQAAEVPEQVTDNVLKEVSESAEGKGSTLKKGTEESKKIIGKLASASMKSKIIAGVVALGLLGAIGATVYFAGNQKEAVQETDINIVDTEDIVAEENTEQQENEEAVDELPFEEGTWQLAYYNYLMDGINDAASAGYKAFDLHDFEEDGVPELVIMYNSGNASVVHFIEGQAEEVYISTDYSYLDGEHLGYGENASQLINLWEEVDEEGRDITHYSLYDNFAYVEKVEVSSIVLNNALTYIIHTDSGVQDISYEEGQAKIQQLREMYQKVEFKTVDKETVTAVLRGYE